MRRIAFSTLCYSSRALEEALEAAARFGLPDVDLGMLEGWVHLNPSRVAADPEGCVSEVERLCQASGTRIVALNVALGRAPSDAQGSEQRLAETAALGSFAQRLGARVLTIQPGPLPEPERMAQTLQLAAENLRAMVDILKEWSVLLLIEPHAGGLCQEPEHAISLVNEVPGLGITYDPSHFACCDIPFDRTESLFPEVGHIHLRDAASGTLQVPWQEGTVDFEWVIRRLEEIAYDGIISIEYVGTEDDPGNVEGLLNWLRARWLTE
jgi:sugar phosphate isomerase/epimerase